MSSEMRFDTPFSFRKSVHILEVLSARLLGDDHALVTAIKGRDWAYLANYQQDYSVVKSPIQVKLERQVAAFFSKNASLPLQIDRQQVAFRKFLETEEKCRSMNRLLQARKTAEYKTTVDGRLYFEVARKVASILGPCPSLDELNFGFGPGANVGLSRLTSVRRKLSALPTCTANAWKYMKYLREVSPHWSMLSRAKPAMHGKLSFVPKNAKTDRCIVVEPLVNTYLQKGIGQYMRDRLKKVGINLDDQSRNQKGALKGSRDGSLATIDLSSASDTISREVVAAVLPFDWWVFLEDFRTHEIRLPNGENILLQKFSSMGCGFTFELETLIFLAIAKVVCPSDAEVSVYGDDIIVPTSHFNVMRYALEQFGFTVNTDKSFGTGVFRESCGKDYFAGIDVRPCYVKDLLSVKELFRLHNFFRREAQDDLAKLILSYIPKRFHLFGPDGFGDGHLLGDHPTKRFKFKKCGWGGYTFRSYQTKPFRRCEPLSGDYEAFLYGTTQRGPDKIPEATWYSSPCDWARIPCSRDAAIDAIRDAADDQVEISSDMYQERRPGQSHYRLVRIYTLG